MVSLLVVVKLLIQQNPIAKSTKIKYKKINKMRKNKIIKKQIIKNQTKIKNPQYSHSINKCF